MNPAPTFAKWVSLNAIQHGSSHSSVRIVSTNADQARRAVEQMIFYGCYTKCMEFGRKTKPRCMNCLEEGHTTHHCKATMMCPYCAADHPADKCDLKGKTMSNCTACARDIKASNPSTDLQELFSKTPIHLHHSPLDPTCPTRLAAKKREAAEAATASSPCTRDTAQPGSKTNGKVPAESSPPDVIDLDLPPVEKQVNTLDDDAQMSVP